MRNSDSFSIGQRLIVDAEFKEALSELGLTSSVRQVAYLLTNSNTGDVLRLPVSMSLQELWETVNKHALKVHAAGSGTVTFYVGQYMVSYHMSDKSLAYFYRMEVHSGL